jgi:ArsR family transcriptional regulator, cadmium/lead-responsive transcriptional repressor
VTTAIDDELWTAIGDPTRRRVLDLLLTGGPGTPSGLSRQLPVTRQAVAKHLAVLERVGLVTPKRSGREVRYGVEERQFAKAVAQLAAVGREWDARLRRIKAIAEAIEQASETPRPPEKASRRGRPLDRK